MNILLIETMEWVKTYIRAFSHSRQYNVFNHSNGVSADRYFCIIDLHKIDGISDRSSYSRWLTEKKELFKNANVPLLSKTLSMLMRACHIRWTLHNKELEGSSPGL